MQTYWQGGGQHWHNIQAYRQVGDKQRHTVWHTGRQQGKQSDKQAQPKGERQRNTDAHRDIDRPASRHVEINA